MNITVNAKPECFNIGCRTFVPLVELLSKFGVVVDTRLVVQVNDIVIDQGKYTVETVKNGDRIKFESNQTR